MCELSSQNCSSSGLMSSQRQMSGTAGQRTIAVLGSAAFFVVAPCTLAGLIPWSITGWQLQPPFLGLELTRGLGAIMILAGVPGLVDAFARFALQGLGTPAPIAPTRNLVVTGLYRHVRNPIYIALIATIVVGCSMPSTVAKAMSCLPAVSTIWMVLLPGRPASRPAQLPSLWRV